MELTNVDLASGSAERDGRICIAFTDQPIMDIDSAAGDRVQESSQLVSAVMPPATLGPSSSLDDASLSSVIGRPRETASNNPTTPKRLEVGPRRSDSSPPTDRRYGPMARVGKRGSWIEAPQRSWDAWDAQTEAALNLQRRRFEMVAEEWVTQSRNMLRSEHNEWIHQMISEARSIFAHSQEQRAAERQHL